MKRLTAGRRPGKTLLLPMPRAVRDELSMRYHLALEALCTGHGSAPMLATLAEVMLVAYFMHEAGYQDGSPRFEAMQALLDAACIRGRETGVWALDAAEARPLIGRLLTLHDLQLAAASLAVVAKANERLQQRARLAQTAPAPASAQRPGSETRGLREPEPLAA